VYNVLTHWFPGITVGSKQLTEEMITFVCGKSLKPLVEKEFGFTKDQIIEAYKLLASGGHMGKIAVKVV
jgi:D-arabinose 1-dehydrogenase-like Zn-dependent alcohol dehydrogenase